LAVNPVHVNEVKHALQTPVDRQRKSRNRASSTICSTLKTSVTL
jgi:hypothetical protein